ncbi:FGGY-family carbohydrate kinase [Photobacterium nomapromontoriensis]|uniref:FGGY-family carbohydrate kinase n=1 Tax=Photobacterium nomapromontoriensis TaxID=2910237 RepID=UPI003D0AE3CF
MSVVIGIDIGTQSTKGLVMDVTGRVIDSASVSYKVETPHALWAQQWPDVWLSAVKSVIHTLAHSDKFNAKEIKAITVSSLYGGSGIAVDEECRALYPCLIWMDRRAEDEVEWIKTHVDLDRLKAITGNGVDSYYGYTKILWVKNHQPEVWAKTRYFLPPNAYVQYWLTGNLAVDHSSAGNIGGVYDIKNRCWSVEALNMLGIPVSMMPEHLVPSDHIVGYIDSEMALDLGLPSGVPIVAGGVDAAVATLAAGVVAPGCHVAMMGTSMCWGFLNPDVDAKHGLISMPHVANALEDNYIFGGAATAGASVSWFRDNFCQEEIRLASITGDDPHYLLEQQAKAISPGAEGVLYLPYLMGERSPIWDPKASGTFVGLSLNSTRFHLYRAVLEGVAFALKHNIECGQKGARVLDDELIVVGGAAFSPLWVQIIADVTGYPVRTIEEQVEAPLGGAFLAAKAVGLVSDYEQIKSWFSLSKAVMPNPLSVAHYEQLFDVYKSCYQNLKQDMHALKALSQRVVELNQEPVAVPALEEA